MTACTPELEAARRLFLDDRVAEMSVAALQAAKHFASGVNTPGDARGLIGSLRHIGITATEIRDGLLEEIFLHQPGWEYAPGGNLQRLFVDTGAFGEVEFGPEGPKVVREIRDVDWDRIFVLLLTCARVYGKRCYVVAPDQVGNQDVTLARQARYADRVRLIAAIGAQVIVPVQKGRLPMSEMFRRSIEILGIEDAIAGVPMKKDATSLDDLRELVASLPRHCRLHLLGIGPESPKFAPAIALILSLRPEADITSDSVTIRRLVGRTNGRGGGPRILTQYQDQLRAMGWSGMGLKAVAIEWQGADEMGCGPRSQGEALGLRTHLRAAVDAAAQARKARLAPKAAPAPVGAQLRLAWSAAAAETRAA